LPQFNDSVLSHKGLSDIIQWKEVFRLETHGPISANESLAIQWQLCVDDIRGAWQSTFDFGVCLNQCTSTKCPQPAQDYMTEAKASACAEAQGLKWDDVASCVAQRGDSLQQQSEAEFDKDCQGCSGPTVKINGGYAGHHPDGTFLAQICGNYSGTKPAGCSNV
jgi:hypothetical protein